MAEEIEASAGERGQSRPEDESRYLVIPDWQREILRERLEDLARNPDDEQAWEEVVAELRPKESSSRDSALSTDPD